MIESERRARVKKSTSLHLAMEAAETLRQISEFPDNPESMAYFYDLYQSRFKDGMILPQNGKKLVGTMCLQVPDELIVAAGAVVTKNVPPHTLVAGNPAVNCSGSRWACWQLLSMRCISSLEPK